MTPQGLSGVSDWGGIKAIAAGDAYTVGLKTDVTGALHLCP